MRIIISPAKKMHVDTDSLPFRTLPQFLLEAKEIKSILQHMSTEELQILWRCNDAIAALNVQRLYRIDLEKALTPAILAYEGIQFRYMAPGVFENGHFDYIGEHLRILSGFYGLLRPFDGVVPHRLEMQAKPPVNNCKNLYAYWGDKLAKQLCSESDFILNLASKEYSRAVTAHLPKGTRLITCVFKEQQGARLIEKGTLCKMARGQMVRFLTEHNITAPEDIKHFNQLGYRFSKAYSSGSTLVFIKA